MEPGNRYRRADTGLLRDDVCVDPFIQEIRRRGHVCEKIRHNGPLKVYRIRGDASGDGIGRTEAHGLAIAIANAEDLRDRLLRETRHRFTADMATFFFAARRAGLYFANGLPTTGSSAYSRHRIRR